MRNKLAGLVFVVVGMSGNLLHAGVISLTNATATFSQTNPGNFPAADAISGTPDSLHGWAIHPDEGQDQAAVFQVAGGPIGFAGGTQFTFTLSQLYAGLQHTIGKFRLSVTTDANPTASSGATWSNLSDISFSANPGEVPVNIAVDGTILLSPNGPDTSIYTIVGDTSLVGITGIRLDVLADPSLPHSGPGRKPENGNFVLSQFQVAADVPEPTSLAMALPVLGCLLRRRRGN